jgi:hypothetical protein
MSCPAENSGPTPPEDHNTNLIVGLGAKKGLVQFDQEPAVLGVSRLGSVQHDPSDPTLVEQLIADVGGF